MIEPDLLIASPISSLENVESPTGGKLLFYDGTPRLKTTSVEDFYTAMQSNYLGYAISSTDPPETGSYWYKVADGLITTFTNLLDVEGDPIGTVAADFEEAGVYYDVTISVTDNVATVRKNPKVVSTVTTNIAEYNPVSTYVATSQFYYENVVYEVKLGQTFSPGDAIEAGTKLKIVAGEIKYVATELTEPTWNIDREKKKFLDATYNISLNIIFSAGSTGELIVDGKGFTILFNGKPFKTDDKFKTSFSLFELDGKLQVAATILNILSSYPYKGLTEKYIEISGTTTEANALYQKTEGIKNYYRGILFDYPHTGNSLANKTYNLVRPFPGRENFQQQHRGLISNDATGIKVPSGDANKILTMLDPFNIDNPLTLGVWFHKKEEIAYGNWLIALVGETETNIYNNVGYQPGVGGGTSDFVSMFTDQGAPATIPELSHKGLFCMWVNPEGVIKISIDCSLVYSFSPGIEYGSLVPGAHTVLNWAVLALLGQNGDAIYTSFGAFAGLTDFEVEDYMRVNKEFLINTGRW